MSVDPFSEPISKLSDVVIYVLQTTANFKPQLTQLKNTLDKLDSIIRNINNLNRQLDRPPIEANIFVDQIDNAKKLVQECLKIKLNPWKRLTHSLKLKDVNNGLLRLFQIEVQADQSRDVKQTLVAVNYVVARLASFSKYGRNLGQTQRSSSYMSVSSSRSPQCENIGRQRFGWAVPTLPRGIVAFKEPLEKLKAKVLAGIDTDESVGNAVVVSAAGGCGKTTLVKMLCNDGEIQEPISKLSDVVIYVLKTTANFKPQLTQLKTTLDRINSIIRDINNLNRQLDRPPIEANIFVDQIDNAKKLVQECLKIKLNPWKRLTHSLKLKDVNNGLLRLFQIEVQADQSRDVKQTLVAVNYVVARLASFSKYGRNLGQTQRSSSFMSVSSRSPQCENIGRQRFGWAVPTLPRGIVAFKEPLEKLKAKVLAGIDTDESVGNVVVVSAAGGCGKTTLVKMLCNDGEIQGKFGHNVFFVTVSETPNFMVIVNGLFNPNSFGLQVPFQSSEDAKNKLDNFLHEVSCPILLVLDDVWSDSFIKNFEFDIRGYKVVVTSRWVFNKYDVFQFDPLSDEDAKTLFHRSARPGSAIGENLVNQMVKCCKKHPLTLSVIGGSLAGADEAVWIHMLNVLSRGQSILDLNDEVLNPLERSFEALNDNLKECYLDFGLFPEDQRIPASALLNMWAHLYNHDEEGAATLAMICELSYRNLVNLNTTGLRRDSSTAKVNYCEQQFVSQHDLLRQLAIKLSGKSPITQRPRLIIYADNDKLITNVQGEVMPVPVEKVQEPLQARIMCISTGESFSSKWCNLKAPNVEVMVLNLMSKTYALPHFLNEMQKVKIFNVANHGVYPTEFEHSHFLGCLSNLLRIRLERVAVSSLITSLGALVNLQKVSFIMCNIGKGFEKLSVDKVNIWPRLVEIEMDYCQDLVEFPDIMCNSVYLKRLSITNCNELCKISEEFGRLTSLESLSLRSCTNLKKLPESLVNLQNLSIIDISDCLSLSKFPEETGNLAGLRTIYMKGCTGIKLPHSMTELSNTQVVCNEEISHKWQEFPNVKIHLVEENRLDTLMKIISS